MADKDKGNIIAALKLAVLSALVVSAVLATTFAQEAPFGDVSSTPQARAFVSRCAKAPPDAEYFVPENLVQHIVPSGSGAYGYREGCPLWIVDFSLNSKSNTYLVNGQRFVEKTVFYGVPHDLPSSLSAGGKNPIVEEDCKRLRVEHFIYKKFKHESAFVFQKHLFRKGQWQGSQNGGCKLTKDPGTPPDSFRVEAPDANVLVIRVATRVKLRTSWQEAAAIIHDIPAQ